MSVPSGHGYTRSAEPPKGWTERSTCGRRRSIAGSPLSPAMCRNRVLQCLDVGEGQACGRGTETAIFLGQRRDTLAVTVREPGGAGKARLDDENPEGFGIA